MSHMPDPRVYKYSSADKLTWEDIIKGDNYSFDRDLMIYILEERLLDHKLLQNPFPRTKWENEPWNQAGYCNWTTDELDMIWRLFVELNREDFKKLVGFCYVLWLR